MALLEFSVIPMGTQTTGVAPYIADIQQALEDENVNFKLTDMGTLIEGKATDLLVVVARLHELPFLKGAQRVVTHITMDDRRDKQVVIGDKVEAVQTLLTDHDEK